MKKLLKKILDWLRYRHMWVIADASDNSITLNKALCHHMRLLEHDQAKVFAFYVPAVEPHQGHYGFILNPEFDQDTQLADIQYNTKHRTIGFEMLVPSVARMFYDYNMPALVKAKLTVRQRKAGDVCYYEICPPAACKPGCCSPVLQADGLQ